MSRSNEHSQSPVQHRRLIDTREVLKRVPFGRTKLNEEVAAGRFPPPVALGLDAKAKRLAWHESEVDNWIAELPRAPRVNTTLVKAREVRRSYRNSAVAA
jgi:prophage regulatory protein